MSFKAVYESLSFKLAAEKLHIPSSNVSRHVAQLEAHLNVRLLQRTTRKMHPTVAGTMLYESLMPNLMAIEGALIEASFGSEVVKGHLSVVMPDLPFLAEVVADFATCYPQIQLSCDTQLNPKEGIVDGVDVVISFHRGKLQDSGWVAKELLRWPSGVVVSPILLAREKPPITLDELTKKTCITTHSVMQGRPWRFKNNVLLTVHSRFKVNSGHMAKAAAIKGIGFALLPLHACESELESGKLVKIELDHEPEDLVLNAVYAGRKHLPAKIRCFIEFIQAEIARLG
ncbi:LysR family transcriptional regulator [Pseudoalteromonas sp. SMS1]|uniref:LysR family transcriptional regulator n=1 Tax=Pseudoalteromonas sp. SMS1 TaxID=2908894 RepID=UPI001F26862A|nr:LysR family transcriptional regulator [Pseudoalteromonas sp. SMS1]MCF2859221.1 LysR family transcriptional regulator [Pseudoalteromonas sp. SMS1]